MEKWIERPQYLDQLIRWKDHHVIKVVTGVRRAGKSVLLCRLYADYLRKSGVQDDQILMVNLEAMENEPLCQYKELYEHISSRLIADRMNYVIIDEVQNAVGFQKAVDGLFLKDNVDIYITGSNAHMLSGELATLLSGRYVTIHVLPFSFREFLASSDSAGNLDSLYRNYVRWGGFPYVSQLEGNEDRIDQYLEGIYSTILKKDIIARNKVGDVAVLEDVIRFVFDNIGNILSPKKISDTLTSGGRSVSRPTVDAYLQYLIDGYAVSKVGRYDIKGKEYLKSLEKYYVTDLGLRNHLLGYRNMDRGHILENVVYLELRRRGYEIFLGKYEEKEIDFVVKKQDEVIYLQVAETIRGEETLQRELEPLRSVRDFHPRAILTLDYDVNDSVDGIRIVNAIEWLTEQTDF